MRTDERAAWLAERRVATEEDYTQGAPTYDVGYDPVTPVHERFVAALLETCPEGGTVLDAACGIGPYMGTVLGSGRRVVGIDQSEGMLARAAEAHPEVRLERIGLQEMTFADAFDAVMVVDAMEHIPPEEWPSVLAGFHRALHARGHLYLTVEQVERADLDRAFDAATATGTPAVFGEDVGDETGGYHFYPGRDQVRGWLEEAGFSPVDEADEWLDGYGYHHLLVRAGSSTPIED